MEASKRFGNIREVFEKLVVWGDKSVVAVKP